MVCILGNTLSYDNSHLAETFSGYPDIIEEFLITSKSQVTSRWVTYVHRTLMSRSVTSLQTTDIHTAHTFIIIILWIRNTTDTFIRNLSLESKIVVCSFLFGSSTDKYVSDSVHIVFLWFSSVHPCSCQDIILP